MKTSVQIIDMKLIQKLFILSFFVPGWVAAQQTSDSNIWFLSEKRAEIEQPELDFEQINSTQKAAVLTFDELYAHTPLKQKFYQLPQFNPAKLVQSLDVNSTPTFLSGMSNVFVSARDLHQSFSWPKPFSCYRSIVPLEMAFIANLPFDQKVVIKNIGLESITDEVMRASFADLLSRLDPGDEVLAIDEENIWSAFAKAKVMGAGANSWSSVQEGLWQLTYKGHWKEALPLKDSLKLQIKKYDTNEIVNLEIPWVIKKSSDCEEFQISGHQKLLKSLHFRGDKKNLERHRFFHPRAVAGFDQVGEFSDSPDSSVGAGIIATDKGILGYLRIDSFMPEDSHFTQVLDFIEQKVQEFEGKTVGLIIDVRDNGGGVYGDILTQFFSKQKVISQTEEIRASQLNKLMLDKMTANEELADPYLMAYRQAVDEARARGASFTARLPINTDSYLNSKGRIYTHQVKIITNPACYSYCDYFVTSMQDHLAAEVWIENGLQTGGGGATVLEYSGFQMVLPDLLPRLPMGQEMGIAFSSGYRTGAKQNTPIENLGADADVVYWTTISDLRTGHDRLLQKMISQF